MGVGWRSSGYFRGAREFFPDGYFDSPKMMPIASEGAGVSHGSCCLPTYEPPRLEFVFEDQAGLRLPGTGRSRTLGRMYRRVCALADKVDYWGRQAARFGAAAELAKTVSEHVHLLRRWSQNQWKVACGEPSNTWIVKEWGEVEQRPTLELVDDGLVRLKAAVRAGRREAAARAREDTERLRREARQRRNVLVVEWLSVGVVTGICADKRDDQAGARMSCAHEWVRGGGAKKCIRCGATQFS